MATSGEDQVEEPVVGHGDVCRVCVVSWNLMLCTYACHHETDHRHPPAMSHHATAPAPYWLPPAEK
jgi:hypothetical protein